MADTLIQDRTQWMLVSNIAQLQQDVEALKTNQVHNAVTEVQMNCNDQNEFTNKQIWQALPNCQIQIVFNDWVYQNFYYEAVMADGSGSNNQQTCSARLYDYVNNAVFTGSTISTTSLNAPVQVRSGLLTKPAATGTYHFEEQFGIGVSGLPDSYVNIYMGRLIARYEGG